MPISFFAACLIPQDLGGVVSLVLRVGRFWKLLFWCWPLLCWTTGIARTGLLLSIKFRSAVLVYLVIFLVCLDSCRPYDMASHKLVGDPETISSNVALEKQSAG